MKAPEPIFAEHFSEVTHHWNLDKLYEDLTDAKQRQGIIRRKPITPTEKACLRGLLSGHTPTEIALKLNREPVGLRVDLSRGLYRYIEMLTGCTLKLTVRSFSGWVVRLWPKASINLCWEVH